MTSSKRILAALMAAIIAFGCAMPQITLPALAETLADSTVVTESTESTENSAEAIIEAANAMTFEEGAIPTTCPKCGDVTWTAFTQELLDASTNHAFRGHYYLAEDITTEFAGLVFNAQGPTCLHLNGHSLTNTTTGGWNCVIRGSQELNIYGNGVIDGGTTQGALWGGTGTTNIYGGTFKGTNSTATIEVRASNIVNFYAGELVSGHVRFASTDNAQFHMYGGTLSGTGKIYSNGASETGTSQVGIYGGTVSLAGGVQAYGKTVNVTGGEITLLASTTPAGTNGINISGNPKIATLSMVASQAKPTFGIMTEGASIGFGTYTGVISTAYETEAEAKAVAATIPVVLGMEVSVNDDLTLSYGERTTPYTPAEIVAESAQQTFGTEATEAYCYACNEFVTWNPITEVAAVHNGTLATQGHYFLANDITTDSTDVLNFNNYSGQKAYCLHLNGKTLESTAGAGCGIKVWTAQNTLNIMGEGQVKNKAGLWGALHVQGATTINVYGGTYSCNSSDQDRAIHVAKEGAVVNIYDATVLETDGTPASGKLHVSVGTINVYGGTYPYGYVSAAAGIMNINGGTFEQVNTVGTVTLSGAPTVGTLTTTVAVDATGLTDGASIGVSAEGVFTTDFADAAAAEAAKAYFTVVAEGKDVAVEGNALAVIDKVCTHSYDNACDPDCNDCGEIRETTHDFADATCTAPKTCTICGVTEGEALGHTFVDATCTAPKTCTVCGATEGEALGHDYADATCTAPKTCTVCGATEGEVVGHTFADATCTEPKTCTVCGATEGEALGHDYADATCTAPKTCTVCGETEGDALGHDYADATCTAPKTCTVCGATEGKALGHTYDAANDAECNTCGYVRETYTPEQIVELSAQQTFGTEATEAFCYHCNKTVTWQPLTEAAAGLTGHYFLANDIIASSTGAVIYLNRSAGADLCLHLNGKTVSNDSAGDMPAIRVWSANNNLNLMGEGTVANQSTNWGALDCQNNGIVNVYGGNFSNTKGNGFTIYAKSTCTMNLYDATITAGKLRATTGAINVYGGTYPSAYVDGTGSITVVGGTITNAYANAGTLTVSGGNVDTLTATAGSVVLSDAPTVGTLASSIAVDATGLTGGSIGLGETSGVFTTAFADDAAATAAKAYFVVEDGMAINVTNLFELSYDIKIYTPEEIVELSAQQTFGTEETVAYCYACNATVTWKPLTGPAAVWQGDMYSHKHFFVANDITAEAADGMFNFSSWGNYGTWCLHLNGKTVENTSENFGVIRQWNARCSVNVMGNGVVKANSDVWGTVSVSGGVLNDVTAGVNIYGGTYYNSGENSRAITMASGYLNIYNAASEDYLYINGDGTATLYNGDIYGIRPDYATGTLNICGGNCDSVEIKAGTVTVSGGTTATVNATAGALNVSGGNITKIIGGAAPITLSGTPVIGVLDLNGQQNVAINGTGSLTVTDGTTAGNFSAVPGSAVIANGITATAADSYLMITDSTGATTVSYYEMKLSGVALKANVNTVGMYYKGIWSFNDNIDKSKVDVGVAVGLSQNIPGIDFMSYTNKFGWSKINASIVTNGEERTSVLIKDIMLPGNDPANNKTYGSAVKVNAAAYVAVDGVVIACTAHKGLSVCDVLKMIEGNETAYEANKDKLAGFYATWKDYALLDEWGFEKIGKETEA